MPVIHNLDEIITDVIHLHPGINSIELNMKVMGLVNPITFTDKEYNDALLLLIHSSKIRTLDLFIPTNKSPFVKTYTLLFPEGTKFPNLTTIM